MAVTREQIAQWSKNFEAKNPGTTQNTATQKKESVSREQINQWSQNFEQKEKQKEQQEKQKKQQEAGEQLNKVTSGLAAGGQMAQQNPAVKYNPVKLKQVKPPENTTDAKARAVTQSRNQQWDRERHASDIGEVDARRDEMSPQLSNDVYAQVNNWKDASTRNRALYELVKKGKDAAPESTEDVDWNGTGVGIAPTAKQSVSDAELGKLGYRPDEIRTARAYVDAYSKLNPLETGTRRLVNTAKSVPASIAGGTAMMMSGLADKMVDSPEEQLTRRLKSGRYTDQQLADVYGADAVSKARERLESGKTTDDVRDEDNPLHDVYSWGRDTHKEGERLMADAQAGEDEGTRFLHGAATSAAENLALASINPALVLPVLSAQGAGDSMAQSDANGEGMTTALLKAGAKFGAGWAINSVGAADLAKTMGSDYAKDTLAGQIADWVKGMAGSSDFAMAHPAVANAISGGMDNAMQAFVETYADKAIDAALGDSEAAENLFSKDTFVAALESGLSGGASGAMGGAVGTGLRGMSEAIDRAAKTKTEAPAADAAEAPVEMPEKERNVNDGVRYSIRTDSSGEKYVQIDDDILAGVAPEDQMRVVRDAIRDLFPDGFERDGKHIDNTREGRGEFVRSKYTRGLEKSSPETHADKMRMAANLDEIIQNTSDVKNEAAIHNNAESFNRGKINVRVGANSYSADVLTAIKNDGREVAYDVVNITPTKIETPNADAPEVSGSSRGTIDTSAEMADRGHPETPLSSGTETTTRESAGSESGGNPMVSIADEGGSVKAPLRETVGLKEQVPMSRKQAEVRRALESWKVTDKAADTISKNMPENVDTEVYAAAASPLYRLGRAGAESFEQALELAGSTSGTAGDINYIMGTDSGKTALKIAYLQGKGEAMRYAEEMTRLGGELSDRSTGGSGQVLYKGTMRDTTSAGSRVIALNAAATGTDAVLKDVLQNDRNVKAYIDTEIGKIYFGDSAEDVFGTVLHEDWHWYNALDAEGARTLQEHVLEYLAKNSGYESIDELIRSKVKDYGAQGLTYEQAAEELVADAWRGIFDSEKSFRRWVEFQRGQAEKNAGKAGTIHRVMEKVRQMLDDLVSRAKEVLSADPDNRAAQKAKRLAEAEKRTLQDEYFAHAEKAMDALRTAKENAAALRTESAAEKQGVRYSINPEFAEDIENWDENGRTKGVRFILGRTGDTLQQLGAKENDIYMLGDKISTILKKHPEMTLNEIKRIPEILDDPTMVLTSQNKDQKNLNTRLVMFGSVKAQDGRPVLCVLDLMPREGSLIINDMQKLTSAYTKDTNPVDFVRNSEVLYVSEDKEKATALMQSLGFKVPVGLQCYGSIGSIAYEGRSVKLEGVKFTELEENNAPVKKTVRYSIDEGFEKAIDELDMNSRYAYPIRVGATSEVLKSIGVKDQNIYWNSQKLRKILNKHSEANHNDVTGEGSVMTKEILKQVPQVLENPIIVLHSDTTRNADYASRIFMYGDVQDAAGKPVNVSLELLPTDYKGLAVDNIVVLSAYGHEAYRTGKVVQGEILYLDTNEKRTSQWLRDNRLRLPFSLANGGSKATLHYSEGNVKAVSAQPLPGQRLYYLQAVTEAEAQRLYPTKIETSGGTHVESEDSRSRLPKVSNQNIAQTTDESKESNAPVKKTVRTQMAEKAEQADREAKRDTQRQASRVLAEKAAAFDTLNQFFGLTRNTRLSDGALESLALRWTKTNGSRADRVKLANETRALAEYLRSEGADMAKAQSLAETLAGEVLDGATYRDAESWNEHPELHDLTYTVDKDGKAKAELVKRYGSWSEAVDEARKHGVKLRQEEGHRDGNPAEQYEAIVNETRAVGGTHQGEAALFRSAAEQAGVAGAASMESTEWLDVLMNVHDAIKPKMMSRFADMAEYEDAKVELAGRMIGDILSHPEMTDAEAVFEGILKHNREVAAMAAGSEEKATEAVKSLRPVQQAQRKAFADRMRQNSSRIGQSTEARDVSRAEQHLDASLETLGAQVSTAAGLDEKLTALREAYEREWKAEKKRMKDARREMLDEIELERRQHRRDVADLARQVKGEQKRADWAEYTLLMRENDILEWEDRNQRKAEAWQRKQAQRNAIAIEMARQQRDEDVAVAKALAEKRVQRVREGRQKDELKRSIRSNAARLNQMALRPKPGKYIQKGLIVQAAEVAKLADMVMLNRDAVSKLTDLQDSVRRSGEADISLHKDWENSGVEQMIDKLRDSMTESKQAELDRLNQQLEEAGAMGTSESNERLKRRLEARIQVTEEKDYLPLTVEQLRMLKAITASTLHVIRTENKTLSLAKAEEVDKMAEKAAVEVQNSGGNGLGSRFEALKGEVNHCQLDMLGGVRLFRRLGGYVKGSQMEQLGRMLNDGQRRQTEILVKGEALFENVTGKAHLKQVEKFAGPGAELVDIGLKDVNGKVVPLNHAQLCSLYMHLRNEDSRHHLMTGGLTLPDAARYARGNIEGAYQRSQTVLLGVLTDADGAPMADTILSTVQDAMTDYDRAWCKDMEEFFGTYTTNLINETSMKLLGYDRATVKNYYPIAVDRSQLATEIEGLKMDATIEGRGFLRERVKSSQPILLEECQNVVKRSLRDTAAYAGLAAPIRDVQRILNSTVETAEGSGILKDKIIREKWGSETVNYINDLLTDLQSSRRKRSSTMSRALDRMRSNYAGAILTVNPGVAIAQAASLPTAGAVLGADTMAAVMPFVKNLSAKQRTALEAEIKEHGDSLLQYRLRGTQRGELASIGVHKNLASRASEAMPALTGWISGMDEITVAALWEGAKQYVENHAGEFAEGAAEKGSEAYWEAVNQMYQRVIEETQPNYTTMQRAGIQRSDNEMVKTLTMFTTQRFQNYGILADAVGDYSAQKARYKADQSAENRAEVERAGKSLQRAVVSQVAQTAVFALMKIGADFLLHRWDREQDENGDVTLASMAKRFFDLYGESFAGNFLYGSEIYNIIGNAVNGTDYDVVSATNISAVNDSLSTGYKLVKLWNKDTSGMSEEELETHHQKLRKAELDFIQYGLELYGVPAANIRKVMQAFEGYYEDALALARGEGFSFDSVPDSATGQYDRLYNAIQSEDSEEAAAALGKLEKMGKADQISSQLTRRLKAYDEDILTAAKARNAGKAKEDETARRALLDRLCRVMGDDRRTQLISVVNKAVNDKADELLKAEKGLDKDAGIYAGLTEELETGGTKDVQAEIDRLLKAGKDKGDIKKAITNVVKSEYLAGSDGDRERLEKKLLDLKDAEGEPLYEEKNFTKWVNDAEKEAEEKKNEKNWWD